MPYIGRGPELGVRSRFIYTATANQTSFSGNDDAGISLAYTDTLYMDVYQNGVLLVPATDYAASTGTSVVLVQGASVDDTVEILVHDIFSVADSVSAKDGGSFAGNVGMGGTLSVTGATTLTGVVTANGGIDVTGTVTADGLTVDGTAYVTTLAGQSDTNTFIRFDGSDVMTFRTGNSEAMRIDASGSVLVGKTATALTSAGVGIEANGIVGIGTNTDNPMYINRQGNDGTLIVFRQENADEGSISVSGTTVSYNGGHLARWSQLADNTRDDTILKGTVLTNLDQMAVWGDEDNEQLNCMAKSSVEGDANVAGVFVNWDNDDDVYTNDMNVAMTGDMIIRIAQGTTVARGDLLMSAGDGTAKPQGDDSVRSKTIAKVTSTHTTCTYDDGSYCVPCVLMAC